MIVNGSEIKLSDLSGKSLNDLIGHFKLSQKAVAVEYNDRIVDRSEWARIELNENDKLELIRFVGGG